jgi:hypothetical protein
MSNPTINRIEPDLVEDDFPILETESEDLLTRAESTDSPTAAPLPPLWAKVLAVAAVLTAGLMIYALIGNLRPEPVPLPAVTALPTNPIVPVEPPPDSLGIRFDEVRELWNSLDRPPTITQALRKFPEGGGLDSFYHLFDTSAVFAGAIDRETNYVAALMVRSNVADPATPNMYLHLCQIVHPFSADCIDNYFQIGLNGKSLEELDDGYHVSWTDGGFEWRVTIEDELQTIRVLGADGN